MEGKPFGMARRERPRPELHLIARGSGEIFRLPSSSSSHVRRTGPPRNTPARSRHRLGTVICPCEVIVAVSVFTKVMNHYRIAHVKSTQSSPLVDSRRLVEHSVIADAKLELGAPPQATVRDRLQACAHLIKLALDSVTDGGRQSVESVGEGPRPDLESSRHG